MLPPLAGLFLLQTERMDFLCSSREEIFSESRSLNKSSRVNRFYLRAKRDQTRSCYSALGTGKRCPRKEKETRSGGDQGRASQRMGESVWVPDLEEKLYKDVFSDLSCQAIYPVSNIAQTVSYFSNSPNWYPAGVFVCCVHITSGLLIDFEYVRTFTAVCCVHITTGVPTDFKYVLL